MEDPITAFGDQPCDLGHVFSNLGKCHGRSMGLEDMAGPGSEQEWQGEAVEGRQTQHPFIIYYQIYMTGSDFKDFNQGIHHLNFP